MKTILAYFLSGVGGLLIGLGFSIQGLLCVLGWIILLCTDDLEKAIKGD